MDAHEILKQYQPQGIAIDTRKLRAGELFVALQGTEQDGHDYLAQAQSQGAVAAVVQKEASGLEMPQFVVPNSREFLEQVCQIYYGDPFKALNCYAVTGTNGKTTVSYFLQSILKQAYGACALSGSIVYDDGKTEQSSWQTTLAAPELYAFAQRVRQNGCQHLVLEASSHALKQGRLREVPVKIAMFTYLGRDHFDYHRNRKDYFLSKAKLFESLGPKDFALLNADDRFARKLASMTEAQVLFYGKATIAKARLHSWGQGRVAMHLPGAGSIDCAVPLIGEHNARNALVAALAADCLGLSAKQIACGLQALTSVPGRMQELKHPSGARIFIDYAHTPLALKTVLLALRRETKGQLYVLFGCGGQRDRGKRFWMGLYAWFYSDHAVLTSDNPRGESPQRILKDIRKGFFWKTPRKIEPDRQKAIAWACNQLASDDVLLIAGKGHEQVQEFAEKVVPFDDRQSVIEAIDTA